MYLCKFDSEGKRVATVVDGIHFKNKKEKKAYTDQGYIETSAEDYAYYVGNRGTGANGTGYIRGSDGKPTDAPAYEPSIDDKKQAIITQYKLDKEELTKYYADAALHDDAELMADLKEEMAALDEKFAKDMEELEA
ncbi:hypothetical protein [Anaerovibrio sp.]|uniref:hypothetical protein n=1 Tax=Anaerovibrio sp. TaxID=1872532 RepID=UPI0025C36C33|nr:hypothetical protein [Anaerovibrio sp.]MBR2143207.1 hypothetical protein [Anaerovibrio sp.]